MSLRSMFNTVEHSHRWKSVTLYTRREGDAPMRRNRLIDFI